MVPIDDEVEIFDFDRDEELQTAYLDEDVDEFDDADEDDDLEDDEDDEDELDDAEDDDEEEDDDLEDEDDDFDDDLDDLEDATDDEIDTAVAVYREDGEPVAVALTKQLANDLDELITQAGRLPGDGGALAMVSVAKEIFVLVRVRGRNVQVLLNDAVAANDWPIARDVMDYLGLEIPDPDDDSEVIGDLELMSDLGVSAFDLERIAEDLDEDSDVLLERIAKQLKFGPQFAKAVASQH